jgi:hypothetical protein
MVCDLNRTNKPSIPMNATKSLLAVLIGLSSLARVEAQVPQLINYQGRVVTGGTNFNGLGQFKFALVNSGGAQSFWSNDGTSSGGSQPAAAVSLGVSNGLYAVLLGDATLPNMTALPAAVFTNQDVRLRVWFNDGAAGFQLLSPDQRVAAVGYALMSANVPDGIITSNKLASGAVTSAKIADGAITAAKLGSNVVSSAALGDTVALGESGVNGRLDVFRTAAGTAAISLIGSSSQISTYGSDGLEQIRLSGTSSGQILLNDNTGNDTTVAINANSDGGGSLYLYHSNNAARVSLAATATAGDLLFYSTNGTVRGQLHGGADGSYLNLYAADGSTALYLDGDNGGAGYISVRNTNGASRTLLYGQGLNGGGQVSVYTGDSKYGAILYGDVGGGGQMYFYNTNNSYRLMLDGYGTDGGGQINAVANDGSVGAIVYGDSPDTDGGEVSVNNGSGTEAAELIGNSYGGRLNTYDENGISTVILGSSSSGGFAYFYQADGGIGVIVDGESSGAGHLTIYGTNGSAVITLDGQDANGNGRVVTQVLQITGGSDLSENFNVRAETAPQAGMVVSIDAAHPGELRLSASPYDRTVAGVISGAGGVSTGMLMGQKGTPADGRHPVALTGRVYCQADASGGAIQPGDLLTTSATPGHAMKVTDHARAQGAIIGKAMTSLEQGKGLVLVLVSLQ